eukprot:COSAG02_NODE_6351_length_3630_cov_2.661852_2_plen_84_part_00
MPGCGGQSLPDPIGLDSGSTGGCKVDWKNASLSPKIGHVEDNTYWTQDGGWSFGCGNATSAVRIYCASNDIDAVGKIANWQVN